MRKPGGRIPDPDPNTVKGQQFQPQHSPMEPSPQRDWLWHVTSSGTIKLLAGISQWQTFNGTK